MKTTKKLIFFLVVICTLVFALSMTIVMEIYKKVLFQNTYEAAVGSVRQIEFNLIEKRENISKSIIKVLADNSLQELAVTEDIYHPQAYEVINNFNKEVLSVLNYSKDFASIMYINGEGLMIGTDGKTVWREKISEKLQQEIEFILDRNKEGTTPNWDGTISSVLFYENKTYLHKEEERYISVVIPCKFSPNPLKEGVLVANIKETAFRTVFSATMEKNRGDIYIMQKEGIILSSTKPELIQQKYALIEQVDKRQKEQYFTVEGVYAIAREIEGSNWWIVWERPIEYFYSEANQLCRILISTVLLSLLIVFAFYGAYTKLLLKPLHNLIAAMGDIGKGKYGTKIVNVPQGEIGDVIKSFNEMSKDIETLTTENIRMNNEKRSLQLLALQEQMNPHFVLNALNTIKWMATLAKEKNIIDMVISLSKIIYAFKNTSAFETIKEEIDFIQNYVKVMNYRYGDVIFVRYDIDEDLMNFPIPIFFIQPLVENSLKHGFEKTNCGGEIFITIKKDKQVVTIQVDDNGAGMEEEKRKEINSKLECVNNSPLIDTGGVGLVNIAKRIQIYYGSPYAIHINKHKSKGASVAITLPLLSETET